MKKESIFILGIIVGAILFGSIGVYATAKYVSKDISYTKKDGTTISVENAITELYDNKINENSFGNAITNASVGGRTIDRSASIELEKGKYIISAIDVYGGSNGTVGTTASNNNGAIISCNNCTYKSLSDLGSLVYAPTKKDGCHQMNMAHTTLYYVEVKDDDVITTTTYGHDEYTAYAQSVLLNAVKIN